MIKNEQSKRTAPPPPAAKKDPRIAKLTFSRMSLDLMKPHPRNPRNHPEPGTAEWAALKASIEHDYFDPLVWNKRNGMLVSGHLRLKVMLEAGYTAADVVVVEYDEATHMARMAAANRSQGSDNNLLLTQLLGEVDKRGVSFALAGFTQDGVNKLLAAAKEEADKTFLNKHLTRRQATAAGEDGSGTPESFPFVIVLDSGQHDKVMEIIRRAKERLGTEDLQSTVMQIFTHYEATALNRKGKSERALQNVG